MGLTDLVTPVATTNWNDRQLSKDDSPTDGCSHFFGAFDAKTHMPIAVANGNKGFKTCTLSCPGLFLYRHDFQYLIFQGRSKKEINDLMLLQETSELTESV